MSTRQEATVLQARELSFGHGGEPLFEAVSLELRAGQVLALLGSSGCGKSSLLRLLAGLTPAQGGQVLFEGQVLRGPHPRAGLLFQQPGLLPWLSCEANVGFGLDFKHQTRLSRNARAERVAEALKAVGLTAYARLHPSQLSGGMLQRAALARALARQPLLLLADEPFSALDAVTRAEMQALMLALVRRQRCASLLVTHDVDEALRLADHIVLMGRPEPSRPARLLHQWPNKADGPDSPLSPAQQALRHELLQALSAQHPGSRPPGPGSDAFMSDDENSLPPLRPLHV